MNTRRIYLEGFQLTVGPGGLLIESTDYHARPLFLDERALGQIGLELAPNTAKADNPDAS